MLEKRFTQSAISIQIGKHNGQIVKLYLLVYMGGKMVKEADVRQEHISIFMPQIVGHIHV